MLKALLVKELLQLKNMYFYDKKKGKPRSRKGIIGMAILLGFLFVFLALFFFMISQLYSTLIVKGYDWLYFSMMGIMAIVAGIFGDIFNTYSTVYQSRDNDFIFSLPVQSSKVLLSKLLTSLIMGFIIESIAFIPAIITYLVVVPEITVLKIAMPVTVWLTTDILIVSLTCLLGWAIALVSSKFKAKNLTKVLAALVFIALYYFGYSRLIKSFDTIATIDPSVLGGKISAFAWPIYKMGLACSGDVKSLLVFLLLVAVLAVASVLLLSKTYIKLATSKASEKKVEYVPDRMVKTSSIRKALIKKEFRRIGQSANYMLNSGIGLVLIIAAAVALWIKQDALLDAVLTVYSLEDQYPWVINILMISPVLLTCIMLPMSVFSASSISLEGENIWILQSAPINSKLIFDAKKNVSFILLSAPVVILGITFCLILGFGFIYSILTIIAELSFAYLLCQSGLFFDVKRPNLDWTSEVVPVKQGFGVTLSLFGGWAFIVIIGGLCFLLRNVNATILVLGLIVVFNVLNLILDNYFEKKASKEFCFL